MVSRGVGGRRLPNPVKFPDGRTAFRQAQQASRTYEGTRRAKRKLKPIEATMRDLALQLAYDEGRLAGFPQVEARSGVTRAPACPSPRRPR